VDVVDNVYSKIVLAGKNRYFFDIKKNKDTYYLQITESVANKTPFDEMKKFKRFSIIIFPEDFNKISDALNESINYVKDSLMKGFDFDKYSPKNKK
jgi:non-homologous end joining protein Ku